MKGKTLINDLLPILIVIGFLFSLAGAVKAGPYVGIYWLDGQTDKAEAVETKYNDPGAGFLLGGRSTGKLGVFGEFGFSGEGVLATAGGYAMTGPVAWELGAAAVPDNSETVIDGHTVSNNEYGVGPMVGLRYEWVSFRYTRYDVTHNYEHAGTVTSASATRDLYWLGVVIPLDY